MTKHTELTGWKGYSKQRDVLEEWSHRSQPRNNSYHKVYRISRSEPSIDFLKTINPKPDFVRLHLKSHNELSAGSVTFTLKGNFILSTSPRQSWGLCTQHWAGKMLLPICGSQRTHRHTWTYPPDWLEVCRAKSTALGRVVGQIHRAGNGSCSCPGGSHLSSACHHFSANISGWLW